MKKAFLLLLSVLLLSCGYKEEPELHLQLSSYPSIPEILYADTTAFDFYALRDSLGWDSTLVWVEECSPYYKDSNPYGLNLLERTKTLCYTIYYDDFNEQMDTALFSVTYTHGLLFAGCSTRGKEASVKKLINHIITNREKY